jgi:hypothetical protein
MPHAAQQAKRHQANMPDRTSPFITVELAHEAANTTYVLANSALLGCFQVFKPF